MKVRRKNIFDLLLIFPLFWIPETTGIEIERVARKHSRKNAEKRRKRLSKALSTGVNQLGYFSKERSKTDFVKRVILPFFDFSTQKCRTANKICPSPAKKVQKTIVYIKRKGFKEFNQNFIFCNFHDTIRWQPHKIPRPSNRREKFLPPPLQKKFKYPSRTAG